MDAPNVPAPAGVSTSTAQAASSTTSGRSSLLVAVQRDRIVDDPHRRQAAPQIRTGANAQAEVTADYWAIFDVPDDIEPDLDVVAKVQARIDAFATRWRDSYPAAVRCLLDDRDSLTVYLRFPHQHRNRIRHSNFIERTFGDTRRRVKVIGGLPGEHSCLKLVWAMLDRVSAG